MGKLIDLVQIKGGVMLQKDVDELKLSYDAKKVLTDIMKDGEPGESYDVNELLTKLKTTVELQLGDGVGSVDGRIEEVKTELMGLLASTETELTQKIQDINETVIKDRVKVKGSLDPVTGLTFAAAELDAVPAIMHEIGPYVVYSLDNQPVVDANGENITYSFETMQLSGQPHTLDLEQKEVMTYKPITEAVAVKVFPVGSFTFETLPADYLLDNEELNLISYSQAIDEIVFRLGQNGDLIEHIKTLVGEEAVQQQIAEVTGAMQEQLNQAVADIQGLTDGLAALAATVEQNNKEIKDEIELIKSVKTISEVFTPLQLDPETIQTSFDLAHIPTEKPVKLYVNGIKYRETSDFAVTRPDQLLTWTFTELAGGFDLQEDFELEVVYEFLETPEAPEPVEGV